MQVPNRCPRFHAQQPPYPPRGSPPRGARLPGTSGSAYRRKWVPFRVESTPERAARHGDENESVVGVVRREGDVLDDLSLWIKLVPGRTEIAAPHGRAAHQRDCHTVLPGVWRPEDPDRSELVGCFQQQFPRAAT